MDYRRYSWVGDRITEEDMARLYRCKKKTRKTITKMVAEAVDLYLANFKKCSDCKNGECNNHQIL